MATTAYEEADTTCRTTAKADIAAETMRVVDETAHAGDDMSHTANATEHMCPL